MKSAPIKRVLQRSQLGEAKSAAGLEPLLSFCLVSADFFRKKTFHKHSKAKAVKALSPLTQASVMANWWRQLWCMKAMI